MYDVSGIKKHLTVVRVLFLIGFIAIALTAVAYYMMTHRPMAPVYGLYKADDGKAKALNFNSSLLRRPITNRSALLEWAQMAVVAANTFNAAEYKKQLSRTTKEYFTAEGASAFNKELADSGLLDTVVSKGLTVTATVQGYPVILEQGVLYGNYVYKVQLPILVNFQSTSDFVQRNYIVTILIMQIPTWQNFRGIGIQQYRVASA